VRRRGRSLKSPARSSLGISPALAIYTLVPTLELGAVHVEPYGYLI
jgi:hypothetical protein